MNAKVQQAYDNDFYAWALYNADLVRQGRFAEIDARHIAEELESMGKSNRRELVNRLAILIAHLLKWQFQPGRRSKSWMLTIKNQRFEIDDLLAESPSLKHEMQSQFNHVYAKALIIAAEQTGIDESEFPKACLFTLDQCLDPAYLPK